VGKRERKKERKKERRFKIEDLKFLFLFQKGFQTQKNETDN
jgi:hypothetical protein